jgi:RNase H-fold protein (predicted Holliday junction resolvase)
MNVPFIIGALNEDGEYMGATRQMIKDRQFKCLIISFPTMNKMGQPANLQLIKQSATIVKDYVDRFELKNVMVPRPGSGIGGLQWADVKAALETILDERFTVVSFESEL